MFKPKVYLELAELYYLQIVFLKLLVVVVVNVMESLPLTFEF
jgi:hypothetical protein